MSFSNFWNKGEVSTASTEEMQKELERRSSNENIFPLDIFHPHIKPFINELHAKYDIPRPYIGLSMFMAYSTAIGTAYAVTRNGSDRLYLSIWGCFNGISSSGKSYCMDMCMEPLNQVQTDFDAEWDDETIGMTDEKRSRKEIHAVIIRDVHIPTVIRCVLPFNPKGIIKESDEILEWINGLNALGKKESTDEQFWLSAWNGRKYSAIRALNLKINIPRVFVNVIGGIQPKLLYKLFKNERGDSGFIFRLLFASPDKFKIAQPMHGYDMPHEFKEVHSQHLKKLYRELPVESGYDDPKLVRISKEATDRIRIWDDSKVSKINSYADDNEKNIHAGIRGKMIDYAYRFAGLLAVTDYAYDMKSTDTFFPNQLTITEDIMVRAIKAADYFFHAAVNIYEVVDNSQTAPPEILQMSYQFKQGKSISEMAHYFLKDKTQKSTMHRKLKKAIKDYPKVFGAEARS